MNKLVSYWFLSLILGLCYGACQPIEAEEVAVNPPRRISHAIDSSEIQYLLYPGQGLLEIWAFTNDSVSILVDSFPLAGPIDFPVGIYAWQKGKNGLAIHYPNTFYKEKLGKKAEKRQLSLALWRENYPRLKKWAKMSEGKQLAIVAEQPCFACPHWMAEVVAQVNLVEKNLRHQVGSLEEPTW